MKMKVSQTEKVIREVDERVFGARNVSGTGWQVEDSCAGVRTISYCGVLGAKSVLDCPDTLKTHSSKFGLPNVSQTTIHEMIYHTSLEDARQYAYRFARYLQEEGMMKLKLENEVMPEAAVGHLDGGRVLTHYGVSMTFGGRIRCGLDFVPCERGGQETAKSVEICKRVKENGIKIQIVTNDGIGYARKYFNELDEMLIKFFIRLRGDDKRNLTAIADFEQALKMRKELRMETPIYETIYDDIKFTVTCLLEIDPVLNKPVLIARIDSEPVGKKLERLKAKEAKRKAKKKNEEATQYEWEEEPEWEKMSEYETTHYVVTNAIFLTPRDVLSIYVDHWTIEIHWRKVKRAYWSRNSYKKSSEGAVVLFISISIGIAITELIKHRVLLEKQFTKSEAAVSGLQVQPNEEKQWTLKRVRNYISEVARSRYFNIAA